jgi:hypothetical protein
MNALNSIGTQSNMNMRLQADLYDCQLMHSLRLCRPNSAAAAAAAGDPKIRTKSARVSDDVATM